MITSLELDKLKELLKKNGIKIKIGNYPNKKNVYWGGISGHGMFVFDSIKCEKERVLFYKSEMLHFVCYLKKVV